MEPATNTEVGERPPALLVVDDEPTVRRVLTDLFEMEGYAVRTAENGADALVIARRECPAAILLDLMMPVLDGIGFLRERAQDAIVAAIPVLVLSATTDTAYASTAITGAAATLTKPFELTELVKTVEHLIGRPRG